MKHPSRFRTPAVAGMITSGRRLTATPISRRAAENARLQQAPLGSRPLPASAQVVLQRVRATIRDAAPDAIETLSYRMPSYHMHGVLVNVGGFKYTAGCRLDNGERRKER